MGVIEDGSIKPFKPVEILLKKVVNRFFSAKNRTRDLDGYARIYIAFKKFYTLVENLFKEFEEGMVNNGILDLPRKTLFIKDIETKIEVIQAENPSNTEDKDINTSSTCIFVVSKMDMNDFKFVNGYKK